MGRRIRDSKTSGWLLNGQNGHLQVRRRPKSCYRHRGVCRGRLSNAPNRCLRRAKAGPVSTDSTAVSRIHSDLRQSKSKRNTFEESLTLLKVSTLKEARKLNSSVL